MIYERKIFMSNYLVTAQAEVLYEKAYGILAKYSNLSNENDIPECIKKIEDNLADFARKIILCDTMEDIENVKQNLTIYENIIDNISILYSKDMAV